MPRATSTCVSPGAGWGAAVLEWRRWSVLGVYVVIGLMDTVHFHPPEAEQDESGETVYSPEVLSLLDLWLTPLRERQEKTYSAPLATHLFAKESSRASGRPDDPGLSAASMGREPSRRIPTGDRRRTSLGRRCAVWPRDWLAGYWWRRLCFGCWRGARATGGGRPSTCVRAGRTSVPWRTASVTLGDRAGAELRGRRARRRSTISWAPTRWERTSFYQGLKSIRTGLVIGTLTTLVMLPAAILLGIMAGYFRGLADDIIQYLYTTLSSIPSVLLIAAAILMLQIYMSNHEEDFASLVERADLRLLFLCIILGVTSWTGLCRLLRGESLKLREVDYVQAAVSLGVSHSTLIGRHILPNVLHIVLISVVLDFSGLVLAEAVLSYINIGVDPTMNSWGNMINSARLELAREPVVWWSLAAAFVFMFTLVLFANLFADVVRDAFDPRLRGAR